MKHIPVLLERVLETLGDIKGKTLLDGTFGGGGYTREFLERGANVVSFDRDKTTACEAGRVWAEYGERFEFVNSPFSKIDEQPAGKFDAIVFDFGVSSMQIDNAERGFSFRFDAPLDMRMGQSGQSAADLIESLSVGELAKILSDYGDVRKAGPIARAIKEKLPKTTFELRDLIHVPSDIAPVFQALRIAVNDELGEIKAALEAVPDLLKPGGKCVCVTFHSLEDRLVKETFRKWTTAVGDPRFPVAEACFKQLKTYRPSEEELSENPRSRSAHLRAVISV